MPAMLQDQPSRASDMVFILPLFSRNVPTLERIGRHPKGGWRQASHWADLLGEGGIGQGWGCVLFPAEQTASGLKVEQI